MGQFDTRATGFMRNATVFADLINIALYNGAPRVHPNDLHEVDTVYKEIVFRTDDKKSGKKTIQAIRDLIKEFVGFQNGKQIFTYFGVESQTDIDYAIPIRIFVYNALQLLRQLHDLKDMLRTNGDILSLLSSVPEGTKFKPVLTIVIYWGEKPWDGPRSLYDVLENFDPALCALIPDLPIVIIEPRKLDPALVAGMRSNLKIVFECMQLAHDKQALNAFVNHEPRFRNMDTQAGLLINEVLKCDLSIDTTKESFNMTQEWREFIEQQQNATITQLRTENQNLKATMADKERAMADKERAMADKERNLKQALRDQGWSEERIRTLFGET